MRENTNLFEKCIIFGAATSASPIWMRHGRTPGRMQKGRAFRTGHDEQQIVANATPQERKSEDIVVVESSLRGLEMQCQLISQGLQSEAKAPHLQAAQLAQLKQQIAACASSQAHVSHRMEALAHSLQGLGFQCESMPPELQKESQERLSEQATLKQQIKSCDTSQAELKQQIETNATLQERLCERIVALGSSLRRLELQCQYLSQELKSDPQPAEHADGAKARHRRPYLAFRGPRRRGRRAWTALGRRLR